MHTSLRRFRLLALCLLSSFAVAAALPAQSTPTVHSAYVILVMTDGFRWQELFGGADPELSRQPDGRDATVIRNAFAGATAEARRAALMPFMWGTMATQGQILGDSSVGSAVVLTNAFKVSYPGYSEAFVGHADPRVSSNDHAPNENRTVFEWLNEQPSFAGRVAAFATWSAFGRIFNIRRSRLPLFDGRERELALEEEPGVSDPTPASWLARAYEAVRQRVSGSVLDRLTERAARIYRERHHPRVLFIGFGETDRWAHAARYDRYLQSAHAVDAYLATLWANVQANPDTRDRTTLIVTTDHGRGDGIRWSDHGPNVVGADRLWIAAIGPDIPALGVRHGVPTTQSQVAATIAAALGLDWQEAEPQAAPPLPVFGGR